MYFVNEKVKHNADIKAVVFDFDGTISVLRQGWEGIMLPLMSEMICPQGNDKVIEEQIQRYISESTGIQTVYQMQWLAQKVKEYGINPEVHDHWWYKDQYNRRLMQKVQARLDSLRSGLCDVSEFLIKGSREFIQKLYDNDIKLYVASGTDDIDVKNEVKALGLSEYFTIVAGAPYRRAECSKEAVIKGLIENSGIDSRNILVIGDGKVEIRLGNEAGTLTLGAATDEVNLYGINRIKEKKLIDAGADAIAGDFIDIGSLSQWLRLK